MTRAILNMRRSIHRPSVETTVAAETRWDSLFVVPEDIEALEDSGTDETTETSTDDSQVDGEILRTSQTGTISLVVGQRKCTDLP